MIKWLLRRRLAAFERDFGYDASYAHDILAVSPRALIAFGRIQALAKYRRGVPKHAYYAAKIVAAKAEDCGPCTQLVVTMAEQDGVPSSILFPIVAGDEAALSVNARLGFRFAEATLAHDLAADTLREEIIRRWGH